MINYRILTIGGVHYISLLESWLRENPEYLNNSYDEMLKEFFNTSMISSNPFSQSLRKLGQEAIELVIDFGVLQKQWAKENGVLFSADNWMFDIMLAQIEFYKPDVIYIQSHTFNIPGIFFKNIPNMNLAEILKQNASPKDIRRDVKIIIPKGLDVFGKKPLK